MQTSIAGTLVAIFVVIGIGVPASAQRTVSRPLRENPYRDVGGSCVYGPQGDLIFAPEGSHCAPQQAAGNRPAPEPSERLSGASPALRAEMLAILDSHRHVAEELARLRQAVAINQKKEALEAVDHVVRELTDHLAREERLFERLSSR